MIVPAATATAITLLGDPTADLPDDCLELIFASLGSGDRKRCSLTCRRWFQIDARSRHRLSLDARSGLLAAAPAIFSRFDSVSKLTLRCVDRRSDSIGDDALLLVSLRCPNLTRLKIRACRSVTHAGMASLASNCVRLRKLSCASCCFGYKGVEALLRHSSLEELSLKRLRGLTDIAASDDDDDQHAALRTICLKEIYNGQCLAPLIARCRNLATLKLLRCSGDWDGLMQDLSVNAPGVVEIHLEKIQVSDRGLFAISALSNLQVLHLLKTPECTDSGIAAVAERCRDLRKIHIDGWKTNRIGDEGLMAVARMCGNLQELILVGINPTSLSLEQIAGNCRNLERLALCSSETFGDAEVSCIATRCVALRKLCIKGCPVSDQGMESIAEGGCPNLVKVKVKKCRGVTPGFAQRLTANRGSLLVNLDTDAGDCAETSSIAGDASSDGVVGRSALSKARHFMTLALRRWSPHPLPHPHPHGLP